MKLEFLPEDFDDINIDGIPVDLNLEEKICIVANAKLREWLEKAPRVYGHNDDFWGPDADINDTHTARLVEIEEIGK